MAGDNSYKPGEIVKVSGICSIVHDDGKDTFEVTCVEGEHFPPTRSGKGAFFGWFARAKNDVLVALNCRTASAAGDAMLRKRDISLNFCVRADRWPDDDGGFAFSPGVSLGERSRHQGQRATTD